MVLERAGFAAARGARAHATLAGAGHYLRRPPHHGRRAGRAGPRDAPGPGGGRPGPARHRSCERARHLHPDRRCDGERFDRRGAGHASAVTATSHDRPPVRCRGSGRARSPPSSRSATATSPPPATWTASTPRSNSTSSPDPTPGQVDSGDDQRLRASAATTHPDLHHLSRRRVLATPPPPRHHPPGHPHRPPPTRLLEQSGPPAQLGLWLPLNTALTSTMPIQTGMYAALPPSLNEVIKIVATVPRASETIASASR